MTDVQLVGLAGAKRSGKNTVAEIIQEYLEADVWIDAFATKLKVAAARTLGLSGEEDELVAMMDECKENWGFDVYPGEARTFGFSGREYLQWFGTECGRHTFGDDFWVDQVLPYYYGDFQGMYCNFDYVLLTDVRFPNEAKRIKLLGGSIWEVQRPKLETADGHASETPLPRDLVDKVIINDGTLYELRNKVEVLF